MDNYPSMQLPITEIEHYLAGTASDAEKKIVNEWYHSFNDEEVEVASDISSLRDQIKARIHSRVQQNIRNQKRTAPVMPLRTKRVAAAAILAAVTATGTYLALSKPHANSTVSSASDRPAKTNIQPGGNNAVLTLADGSQIVLDSAQNGTLRLQGNTRVIKLDNGQLAYKTNTSTPISAISYNTISTPRGGQYKIVLADGTEVWLNSASSLKFPTAFAGEGREVFLSGEGYFEVKGIRAQNNRKIPFIVSVSSSGTAKDMKVKVLGTKFNIMAYGDEEAVKTTLIEGAVSAANSADSILIRPGQQAAVKSADAKFSVTDADIKEALAWKNGEFRFKEMNIKSIMRQLARWYNVDVGYRGDLANVELSGVIAKKENILQLLDVLETTGKVHFQVSGNRITAMPYARKD